MQLNVGTNYTELCNYFWCTLCFCTVINIKKGQKITKKNKTRLTFYNKKTCRILCGYMVINLNLIGKLLNHPHQDFLVFPI
jgi:hypothetical protein